MPVGFGGSHTTLSTDSIQQATAPVHGGTSAMTLLLGETGAGILSTTPLAVNAYQFYEVRFWVQGQGRIATGLYDGRLKNGGFAPANADVEVHSAEWQYVMQTVMAINTTTAAEFLFDVEAIGPGSALVIDDVTINTSQLPIPTPATIREIQETSDFSGTSPLNYVFVRTKGVITALSPNSVFIQDGSGPWSGIEVRHTPLAGWAIGDSLRVVGTVDELGGLQDPWQHTRTHLITIRYVEVLNIGNPVPLPAYVLAGDLQAEEWESVLVQVPGLECLNAPDPLDNHWPTSSASGNVTVDDFLHYYFPTIGAVYTITGIAHFTGTTVLLPRMDADIQLYTGIGERTGSAVMCFPNPANDHVTLLDSGRSGKWMIQLLDATGRLVWSTSLAPEQRTMDLQAVPNGTYLIRVMDGEQVIAGHLVVQH